MYKNGELVKGKISDFQKQIKKSYDNYWWDIGIIERLVLNARKCESPIEAILFWEFIKQWDVLPGHPAEHENANHLFVSISKNTGRFEIWGLENQAEINIANRQFRVDFLISCYDSKTGQMVSYCIEVDGHDFHEKTKEQARRDKQRDRLIQSVGYRILHFTGSEVYRNVTGVVDEILNHIVSTK